MELKLEVVLSSSIKRKKPWPRFCWLGQEKESVFLLDDKRISEINMVSGRTKKRTPKLHPLLNSVVTMSSSHNGVWLCGVLVSGELFLWNRDKDLLKTARAAPEVTEMITSGQGKAVWLSLKVSGDGMRVLLVTITGQVFLWECADVRDLGGVRDGTVGGHWAHIKPLEDTVLPLSHDKEASQHTVFVKTEAMGDVCLSALVFTSGQNLVITCLKIQWEEGYAKLGALRYSIQWATKTYPMSQLNPPCQPVKSGGALVPAFSPDGQLLAIVLNQRRPKATQVLYVSTQNFVSLSSSLGGCGIKTLEIPPKYIRSYWVGSINWSPNSLLLACVLKRGSLLMLTRLGGLLTLTSSGCNVDFGPAQFLPLHPLVTYRPPVSAGLGDVNLSSSSLSIRDVLRQRYSVTWHPRLFYLIVSDGYMATVMNVLDRPSPALLLKSLLKDTSRDLERASEKLEQSQIHVKAWLESVSCLNQDSSLEAPSPLSVTYGPTSADSVFSVVTEGSTLPLFLQDQETLGGTKGLLERMQSVLDDDSDLDETPVGSHTEDGGRLEFASMFDTLHALDTDTAPSACPDYKKDFTGAERRTHRELCKIQSKLLTAWALSISLGNALEHRARLMKHMLCCLVRLAALLHLISNSAAHTGKKNGTVSACLLHLIKALLSFLPWDGTHSNGPSCLGTVVELSKQLARLLLTPHPESYQTGTSQLSGQHLSTILHILHLVSDSLDHTCSLQQKLVWSSSERECVSQPQQPWPSDVHHVPLLQDMMEKRVTPLHRAQPVPQQPSSRLLQVWQWVYKVTLMCQDELKNYEDCDGWEDEQQRLTFIMSQIQIALQATGEGLTQGPALLDYPGEHLFLCGLYSKSTEAWRSQICDESNKICDRRIFQEERLCLAHLYSLLYQYRLREAQELGDHMALLILQRAGHQKNNTKSTTDSLPCPWLPADLHSDAAHAVVQSLGRFMASYFANQPLHILPPHNVAVLPPLHLPHAPSVGRLVPLCQEEVATAVRRQHLSEVWTVDYALDLLLLGGLLPEAVWLAYHLGDWKTAVSLSLAFKSYCADHWEFAQLRKRELHLPPVLDAERMFQAELEFLLGTKPDSQENRDTYNDKSFTDPSGGEDWDLLLVSMQEILKASVMAGVNVISSPLSSLLDTAKDLSSSFSPLVPSGLHLPAPPLYCPQPSANTQDPKGTAAQLAEVALRHKMSALLQKLLLLLRSGRCCQPAAQWYITHLRRARHILHKIQKKYSYPGAPREEKAFPEGLMKFVTRGGFFKRGPKKDGHLDPDAIQIIICFREMCGLCWMLHVRDQLSISCRKYQAARQHCRDEQIPADLEVRSRCVDALHWARRFQPFAHFLNAEEILQDVLLSLVSELPAIPLVADTLVQAFPGEEESVRVPLREKFNSLLQRLRQCSVPEEENEEANEPMIILIQDKRRHRRKHLGRLRRHLAPPELHLWEKEEADEDRGSKHGMTMLQQFSLGTSLGTTCGFPTVCSDGDTAENTSEAISPEQHRRPMSRDKKVRKVRDSKNSAKIERAIREEASQNAAEGKEKSTLPVVGTWEFELEDEEYLNFLELFLSYELEKESADGGDSASELPLLRSFSSQLKERELHSLTFDVLSTIHRRQRDAHSPGKKHCSSNAPVFRAGCCYRPVKQIMSPEQQTSSICNEVSVSRTDLSVGSLSGPGSGKLKGLFSRRMQSTVPSAQSGKGGSEASTIPTWQPSGSSVPGFSTSVEAGIELQQGLDPKLEAQFPELGRLLEWMVRWADRRVLLGHHGRRKRERGGGVGGTADEGVVIRVKASAPAVLTSLSLLEWRYAASFKTKHYGDQIQVPETQWTVAPVLQPVVNGNLERESSVDTGYPGSANTLITGLDHNQGDVSLGSCTEEPEELTHLRKSLADDQDEQSFHAEQSSSQPLCLDDLDVTPEKEGKSSGSEALELSALVSCGNIREHISTPSLNPVNAEDTFTSTSLSQLEIPRPVPQTPPSVQPKASVFADVSDSVDDLLPYEPVNPPNLQSQGSLAAPPPPISAAPDQPSSNQTPQMRQQLGEDLFRLVQNINYMSMMEVLGASFSSLQLAQQNSSLAQPHLNFSHPYASSLVPQPNAPPVQTDFTVAQALASVPPSGSNHLHTQPVAQNSGRTSLTVGQHQIPRNLSSTAARAGVDYPEMPPLSVQVETPGILSRADRTLIPSSQGLLVTTAPSNVGIQNDLSCQVSGLKLLQARYPPLPQQSASHYPPAQDPQMPHTINPESLESHRPKSGHQATPKRSLRRQLSFDHSLGPAPCSSQPPIQRTERFRAQEFPILPSAHTPAQIQGLRLLQLQQRAHNNITFPKLPIPLARPPSDIAVPVGTPVVKLLHIQPRPTMISPMAVPSQQMSRLISMDGVVPDDILNESTNKAPTSPGTNFSQRQRRREERASTEKHTVTFKPTESNIPLEKPPDEPVNEDLAVGATPVHDIAIPLGSFDSSLTGQRLLDKVKCTSAELHAFAAACYKTPECHDAFTNTDLASPPILVDKAVSASVTPISPKSPSPQNHKDGEETSQKLQNILDAYGHQFISVLDLEDKELHNDFPFRSSAVPPHSGPPPLLPVSQLHVLSTSVIRSSAAAPAIPQSSVNIPDTPLQPTTDVAENTRVPCRAEPSVDPERVTSNDIADPSDSPICQAIKTLKNVEPLRNSASPRSAILSSRLPEMDAHLDALQKIANSLEKDFSNSCMLVPPVSSNRVERRLAVKQNLRLSVPRCAWAPQSAILPKPNATEEEKEEEEEEEAEEGECQEDESLSEEESHSPDAKPSLHHLTPSDCHGAGSSSRHSPPTDSADASGISQAWEDETLGQSGLLDTAKLLEELEKEGYICRTDLDSSPSQTAQHTRQENLQESSGELHRRALSSEEERRELRTWMRQKQRARLATYRKHREGLRQRERKPFPIRKNVVSSSTAQANLRARDENEKLVLLEQFNQRTRDACILAGFYSATPPVPGSSPADESSMAFTSSPIFGTPHRVHRVDKRSPESLLGQTQMLPTPWKAEAQGRPLDQHRRRLGLDRPATSLPKDRLSQVTRRGMITGSKRNTQPQSASQKGDRQVRDQRKMQSNKPSPGATVAGRGIQRGQTKTEDGEEVLSRLWNDDGDDAGASAMDWLNLSTSEISCLSKIDWDAIERMLAEGEN